MTDIVVFIIIFFVVFLFLGFGYLKISLKKKRLDTIKGYIRNQSYKKAINNLKAIINKNQFNYPAHKLLADVYSLTNNKKLAIVEYRFAEKGIQSESIAYEIELRRQLSLALEANGNQKEALEELLLLLKVDEKNPELFYSVSKFYFKLGNSEKAINYMYMAVNLDSNNAKSYYELGVILYKASRYGNAIDAFSKSLKINKDNLDAYYYLGSSYRQVQDYRNAIAALNVAERKKEYRANSFLNKGICHIQLGNEGQAVNELTNSLMHNKANNKSKLFAHYYIASIYENKGEIISAIEHWEQIHRIDNHFKDVVLKLNYHQDLRKSDLLKEFMICSLNNFKEMSKKILTQIKLEVHDFRETDDNENIICVAKEETKTMIGTKAVLKYLVFNRSNKLITDELIREYLQEAKRFNCNAVTCFTTSSLTTSARDYVSGRPFHLISGESLDKLLKEIYKK